MEWEGNKDMQKQLFQEWAVLYNLTGSFNFTCSNNKNTCCVDYKHKTPTYINNTYNDILGYHPKSLISSSRLDFPPNCSDVKIQKTCDF